MTLETINLSSTASRRIVADGRILGLSPASLALALLFILFAALTTAGGLLADFRAGWMAGKAFAAGNPHLVYPEVQGIYALLPPDEWVAALRDEGFRGVVYPFVYPPIWAWFAAQFTKIASFETIAALAGLLNAAMVVAMLVLTRRLVAPATRQSVYLLAGLVFLAASAVGFVGLRECQPQIFVAFLTLLAIERSETGHPRAAGTALALAASIKLFPALIALLFLARRQYRSAGAFAIAGATLAALSIAVAGWPLHREFLGILGDISATTFVTAMTYSLESSAAQIFYRDELQMLPLAVTSADLSERFRITVLAEPAGFSLFFGLLQVSALAAITLFFRRMSTDGGRRFPLLLWPFALMALALTGPLAWAYYYLAPIAFIPALLDRLPAWLALIVMAGAGIVLSPFAYGWLIPDGASGRYELFFLQGSGTLMMTAITLLFLGLALGDRRRAGMLAS